MRYAEIKTRVLRRIKPTTQERKKAHAVAETIREALAAYDADILLGGSLAKGTWLRDNHDIDVFVRFPDEDEPLDDRLERILDDLGWEHLRIHGSRDYFELAWDGYSVELIPVLRIEHDEEARNVTDMSPLHVQHVAETLTARRRDEVRLAKQFCKACRAYGAESYVKGFSGHVLELLIGHYGTFRKLIEAAATWGRKTVLDVAGHHDDPLGALDPSKTRSPLVIVDPVQPGRNAAAALSRETYERFVEAARRFAEKPTIAAFEKPRFETLIPHKPVTAVIEFSALEEKKDTAGTKCLKAFDYLVRNVEHTVLERGFDYDHETRTATAYLCVKESALPSVYEHYGPPVEARKDARRFREKHPSAYERGGRLIVKRRRTHRTIAGQLTAHLKDDPVTRRVKDARILHVYE